MEYPLAIRRPLTVDDVPDYLAGQVGKMYPPGALSLYRCDQCGLVCMAPPPCAGCEGHTRATGQVGHAPRARRVPGPAIAIALAVLTVGYLVLSVSGAPARADVTMEAQ
jgi:hypothetical protein